MLISTPSRELPTREVGDGSVAGVLLSKRSRGYRTERVKSYGAVLARADPRGRMDVSGFVAASARRTRFPSNLLRSTYGGCMRKSLWLMVAAVVAVAVTSATAAGSSQREELPRGHLLEILMQHR